LFAGGQASSSAGVEHATVTAEHDGHHVGFAQQFAGGGHRKRDTGGGFADPAGVVDPGHQALIVDQDHELGPGGRASAGGAQLDQRIGGEPGPGDTAGRGAFDRFGVRLVERALHRSVQRGEQPRPALGIEFGVEMVHPVDIDPAAHVRAFPLLRQTLGRIGDPELAHLTTHRSLELLG
jgi:hypothetical protein